MVKKLVVNKVFSDSEMKEMEGTWIDESHIKHPVVNDSTDVYYIDDNGYRFENWEDTMKDIKRLI